MKERLPGYANRVARWALLGATLGGVAGLAHADNAKDTVAVVGRVFDHNNRPVADASVEIFERMRRFDRREVAKTDADGFYHLGQPAPGKRRWLVASAPGHAFAAAYWQPRADQTTIDFRLAPLTPGRHRVAGRVIDRHGDPVVGATVRAYTPLVGFSSSFTSATGREYFPGPDRHAVTDSDGRFAIEELRSLAASDEPLTQVRLEVRAPHRYGSEANYPLADGLVIRMGGSGTRGVLRGRMIDRSTGDPIRRPHAVRLIRRNRAEVHTAVDEEGRFELPGRPTLGDRYSMYAYVAGYAAREVRLRAVAGDEQSFPEVHLSPAPTRRVRLVDDETGAPLRGVKVLYRLDKDASYFEWPQFDRDVAGSYGGGFAQHATSDRNGELWFVDPPGVATAEVGAAVLLGTVAGYEVITRVLPPLDIDETTGRAALQVIRLRRESALRGVVMKGDQPVAGGRVTWCAPKLGNLKMEQRTLKADQQGRFTLRGLAAGKHRVWANGCFCWVDVPPAATVDVVLGADVGELSLHGAAPPGATLTLRPTFNWEYQKFEAKIGDDGRYEFTGLKPGRYRSELLDWSGGSRRRRRGEIVVGLPDQREDFSWFGPMPQAEPAEGGSERDHS